MITKEPVFDLIMAVAGQAIDDPDPETGKYRIRWDGEPDCFSTSILLPRMFEAVSRGSDLGEDAQRVLNAVEFQELESANKVFDSLRRMADAICLDEVLTSERDGVDQYSAKAGRFLFYCIDSHLRGDAENPRALHHARTLVQQYGSKVEDLTAMFDLAQPFVLRTEEEVRNACDASNEIVDSLQHGAAYDEKMASKIDVVLHADYEGQFANHILSNQNGISDPRVGTPPEVIRRVVDHILKWDSVGCTALELLYGYSLPELNQSLVDRIASMIVTRDVLWIHTREVMRCIAQDALPVSAHVLERMRAWRALADC